MLLEASVAILILYKFTFVEIYWLECDKMGASTVRVGSGMHVRGIDLNQNAFF